MSLNDNMPEFYKKKINGKLNPLNINVAQSLEDAFKKKKIKVSYADKTPINEERGEKLFNAFLRAQYGAEIYSDIKEINDVKDKKNRS